MATRGFVPTDVSGRVHRFTWAGLLNGDDGVLVSIPGAADMSVQVFGTFGSGGTIIVEGTLELLDPAPTNFFTLRDGGDNPISFAAADGEMVGPVSVAVRPRVTAGDGTTDLTMILIARSTMR